MTIPKPPYALRLLHTADWHLGKRLVGETRYDEFGEFLDWLAKQIAEHCVDVLVVAGDVFDTMTPSNKAQELYYNFLGKLSATGCRHAVIIAGNHDSPSLLDAPKSLFRHFNIQVIGGACDPIADELLILDNKDGNPALIVAGVPYLRDKDVRKSAFNDSLAQKESATIQGIYAHYRTLANLCKDKQNQLLNQSTTPIPLLATGHLFATGASVSASDDGMRSLYVGTLGQIGADCFDGFDYVALGHIHREQTVGKQPHIRYSGSPMAMGFGEQGQDKKVLIVDFDKTSQAPTTPSVHALTVPIFRQLKTLTGSFETVTSQLTDLKNRPNPTQKPVWLSLEIISDTPIYDLQNKIDDIIADSELTVLSLKNILPNQTPNKNTHFHQKSLKELTPDEVFLHALTQYSDDEKSAKNKTPFLIDDDKKQKVLSLYQEIVHQITNDDKNSL